MTTLDTARRDRTAAVAFSWWALAPGVVQFAALMGTADRYGYHPDELYFIVCGQHPAWGYPDQPMAVPLLAAAMNDLDAGSLTMLRAPSALAAALTCAIAALIARECGGRSVAQVIAAACTAVSAFALATGHNVSTTTFDMLSTTLLGWLVIRTLLRHQRRALLAAGLVVGVGFEFKPQVALVALVLITALALTGPRWPLRSPHLWVAAGLAVGLALPYLFWQAAHGWPQTTVAANIAGDAEGGRIGFLPFQLVLVSLVLVPVWLAGLVAAWRHRWPGAGEGEAHQLRTVTITYIVLALLYLIGDGKAYYLASLYPLLLAIGAVPTAAWLHRGRAHMRAALLTTAVILSAAFGALTALPVLPARDLQGSATMALNPDIGQQVGWPEFVHTVDMVWTSIPASTRTHTVIFTSYYGEAAAVDLLGRPLHLPIAYSGHNAFTEWGPPPDSDRSVLLLGYPSPASAQPQFHDCQIEAHINDEVDLNNDEQGLPVMLCQVSRPWRQIWPALRHYD